MTILRRLQETTPKMVPEQQNAMTPQEAAKYIGVSEATLRLWRSRGEGPRYFRAGEKLVRYRRSDLDAWIETRLSRVPCEADCEIIPVSSSSNPFPQPNLTHVLCTT